MKRFALGVLCLVVCLGAEARTINVIDAGAAADGRTDDTAVFQQVMDELTQDHGGIAFVPSGVYCIRGNLVVPTGVTLKGEYESPPSLPWDEEKYPHAVDPDRMGSVLLAYAGRGSREGRPFIHLDGIAAVVRGLTVYYPEWQRSDVPPVPYPPTILVDKLLDNTAILDCLLFNSYEAIHIKLGGRHLIRNVQGYPSWRGLYVDESYDIGRIENVHFWPFGAPYDFRDPYTLWVNTHGVAFEFARADWQYVLNTFCFGYGIGYKFSSSDSGVCNGNFIGLGADSCERCVVVEQTQPPGLQLVNGEFVGRWGGQDSVCVDIRETCVGKVSLMNCGFWGNNEVIIHQRSDEAQLTAQGCNFHTWDKSQRRGYPAVWLEGGKAILQGNTFGDGDYHVRVEEGVRSAIVMGNQAQERFRVQNHAGERTQLVANEKFPEIAWLAGAKRHYRVNVGAAGDAPYLRRFHQRESSVGWWEHPTKTLRWSAAESLLLLPAEPGQTYTLAVDVKTHKYDYDETNGLYVNGRQVARLPGNDEATVAAQVTAATDTLTVVVRCHPLVPTERDPRSMDERHLGARIACATMTADPAAPVFNANTGEWLK